jgi:hypothetical protein
MPYSGVLVNLGKDPAPGKVYGVDVTNRYRKTIHSDVWGPIHFFVKPDKDHMKMLRLGLDVTAKKLEKMDLLDFMGKFQTEIRAKKGKYAGMYVHDRNGESKVWYAPETCGDQATMNYVIFHEFGHVLRYNGLTRVKARARWQRMFQQSIAPVVVSKKNLDRLLAHLLSQAEIGTEFSLGNVIKEYAAEDESIIISVKALTRWMRNVHHISPRELDVLWSANDTATLQSLWPTSSIDTSKLAPILTDYATRNVEELVAESFAYYALGKKLPAHIHKLLERSLDEIRSAA